MYFSKNSRYVLQRGNWLSPSSYFASSWRKTDRNFSVKYPQEDPAKPSLRVNIPKDTQQAEAACSKLIHESANIDRDNFSIDNKSRSLIFKHPPLGSNLDKDILKTCSSETRFPEDEILSGTNFGKEAKNEESTPDQGKPDIQTTESLLAKKENEYCEGLKTPLNDQYLEEALANNYLKATATEANDNKWDVKFPDNTTEKQSSDAESKTLFIIIDVPEREEKTADADIQTKKVVASFSATDDPAATKSDPQLDKRQDAIVSKVKVKYEKRSDSSPPRDKYKKDFPHLKSEGHSSKRSEKTKVESQDADDNPTYVLQLRFKKNFFKKSCRVGCVPEKEINTRSPDTRQNGIPIRVRDSAPRKMLKTLTKEIATVEELPEIIRYSELKKLSFKSGNVIKSKLWTYGTFSKVNNSKNAKVKNEVPVEPSPKKYLEPGTYSKAFSHHQFNSKPQEVDSESSLNIQKASTVQDTKSEGSLNLQQAPQVQDAKIEDSTIPEPIQQVQETNSPVQDTKSEGSLNVQHASQVQEADSQVQDTRSEGSLNVQHAPQVQEADSQVQDTRPEDSLNVQHASQVQEAHSQVQDTKPEDSLNVQQASQVQEADSQVQDTKSEGSLDVQHASQVQETKSEGSLDLQPAPPVEETTCPEEQNVQSESRAQLIGSENSLSLQYTPQVQDTKSESCSNLQNDTQVQQTNAEPPAAPEPVSVTNPDKPNKHDFSARETETSKKPGGVHKLHLPKADKQTLKKETGAFTVQVVKDSHSVQSKGSKQKFDENKTNEPKQVEKKISIKKFDKKNWLEKKMRKPGKYAEFQFHSDSKSTRVPVNQVEKSESDITDFKKAPAEIKIVSDSGQNYYHTFSAAYSPLFAEAMKALRKTFIIKQETIFNDKWCTSRDCDSKNFELNPKCLSKYSSSIFFSNTGKEKMDCDYLLEGKKEVILNVGKAEDLAVGATEPAIEDMVKSPVDGLTLMKKVKEILDFDLNNAIKIFEGRYCPSDAQTNVSSVIKQQDGEWKMDTEELGKCEEVRKMVTANEINMASSVNKKDGDGTYEREHNKETDLKIDNLDFPKCFLQPEENKGTMKEVENHLASVITYNPVTDRFVVEEEELEFANQRSRELFESIMNDREKVAMGRGKGSIIRFEMKEGDSILVFDEDTQTWKVDFSILEKREEQMKQEMELRKASELILETFEKMEKTYTPTIPTPESREKRIFDYNTGEWKILPMEGEVQKPTKSPQDSKLKSKYPFKESDAEEIRKKNSELYEDLFVAKNEPKINEKDLTQKEKGFNPIEKKKAKESDLGPAEFGERMEMSQGEAKEVAEARSTEPKDDGFWESFLKMDILPKTIRQLSKIKVPPTPKAPKVITDPEPKLTSIKMPDIKFKIPLPFGGNKKSENPKKKKPSNKNKMSGDAVTEEPYLFQADTNTSSTVSPPISDAPASKETESVIPESLQSVLEVQETDNPTSNSSLQSIGTQQADGPTSNSTEPRDEPEPKSYSVFSEVKKTEDPTPKSYPPYIEIEPVEDSPPKSSPPSIELKQTEDPSPKSSPLSSELKLAEDPSSTSSPPSIELKQTEDPSPKSSPLSSELKLTEDPSSTSSPPSIELKQTEDPSPKSSPLSSELKLTEDPLSTSSPASIELKQTEDSTPKSSPPYIELKPTEDPSSTSSPSSIELKQTEDPSSTSSPPSIELKQTEDSTPKSSLSSELKQTEDFTPKSSPPSIELKQTEDPSPKSSPVSIELKQTEDPSPKSSPLSIELKQTEDSSPKSSPPSVEVQQIKDSETKFPSSSVQAENLQYSKPESPPPPIEVKQIDEPKPISSPSSINVKKTSYSTPKSSASTVRVKKAKDSTPNSFLPSNNVKKVDHPKPKSYPSSIDVKKVDHPKPKSSTSSLQVRKTEDFKPRLSFAFSEVRKSTDAKLKTPSSDKKADDAKAKAHILLPEVKLIENSKLKSYLPVVEVKKTDDSLFKSSRSPLDDKQIDDAKPKSTLTLTEVKKAEDIQLKFTSVLPEVQKTEDRNAEFYPSAIEVKKVEDTTPKTLSPSIDQKKVEDSLPIITVVLSDGKKSEDTKLQSTPVIPKVEKVEDAKTKSALLFSEVKTAEDTAPKTLSSSTDNKKVENSLPIITVVLSEGKKAEDSTLRSTPLVPEVEKLEDAKTKSALLLSELNKMEDPKPKSSPVLSEVSKTDPVKQKTFATSIKVKKPNDSTQKASDDVKLQSVTALQKPEVSKSSPTAGEIKKTTSSSKPSTPGIGAQKRDYPKSNFPSLTVKTEAVSKPSALSSAKKDKTAADHYVSENILAMTRTSTKDTSSKMKSNKVETVKLNIKTDKRPPLKITEINLNKKCEDKAKEPKEGLKKQSPSATKNSEKCSKENNTFYKNFEKYKSSFSDPEYEEKPMKINSNTDGNPNLKKLDTWNKTLVLQDIVKPPENIESWLKDETDKMATLLLKVLQEAADGKPKRTPGKAKTTTTMDKLRSKGNPYHNIRKKQEDSPSHFLIKVHTGTLTPASSSKPKPPENKKPVKPEELIKDFSIRPGKMEKLTANPEKHLNSMEKRSTNLSMKETTAATGLEGQKNREIFDPLVFSSGDILTPNKNLSEVTEDVPGPEILKKISSAWKVFPVLSTQVTTFTLFSVFQLMRAANAYFSVTPVSKHDQQPLSKLFAKYGPIVNVQGPLSGSIILIHKPEHLFAVFEQDTSVPARSVFDSIEQCRRHIEGKVNSIATSTDWSNQKWTDLKRALNDPLEKGSERFFPPVEQAAAALVKNVRRNRNGQNYASRDFMEEIRSWSMEGLCNVLFEKSFSFLEGRSKNINWMLEPDKLYLAVDEATECLSKCEKGFHGWRLLPTPAFVGLGQAYLTLSTVLSKQLYQADLNLKNKHEILRDGILINSRDMTFMESMLLNDGMTMDEITCNLIDIILVGINTMSSALGFLLYDLSQNMRVQNKLLEEVKELMSDKSSNLDYHKLHSLKYLQACVKESIRLHMPFPVLFRVLQNDILLSNYMVNKGTFVVMDTKVSQLKEQNFAKADDFIPERWLSSECKDGENDHPFSFFPFCHGPRADLAKRVVEMQLWAGVAKVIRNFQIEYHHAHVEGTKNFISFPDKPLKFNFLEREE